MADPERSEGVSRRRFLLGGGAALAAGLGGAAVGAGLGGRGRDPDDLEGATRPAPPSRAAAVGSWSDLISLGAVAPVHASLLPSGGVLFGGIEYGAKDEFPNFVFDPGLTGPIRIERMRVPIRRDDDSLFCAGHAYLADGRMLQVGGSRMSAETGLDYGVVFDGRGVPARWTPIGPSIIGGPAWYPTVTRLANASMLVNSGFTDFGTEENRTLQLFHPPSFDQGRQPWSLLVPHEKAPGISPSGADYTHVFQLPRPIEVDGSPRQVALIGKNGQVFFLNHVDPFEDPAARLATLPNARRPGGNGGDGSAAGASSVILPDGSILIVGGGLEGGDFARSEAHIYDPYRDSWRTVDTGTARSHPAAVLLPDGTVLVVNGDGGAPSADIRRPQIVDPVSATVSTGPPWPDRKPRGYHNVAILLPDGKVLTGGGDEAGQETERPNLRYYSPPYLSVLPEADRPAIVRAAPAMGFGSAYSLLCQGGPIHKVTLVALGSMTHSFDQNQRCVVLFEGEGAGGELTITGPRGPSVAPPGDYMLFVLRRVEAGGDPIMVPSVARIIRVTW